MNMTEYQERAGKTAIYKGKGEIQGLSYAILGLLGEAGELANQAKKILRGDPGKTKESFATLAESELGDVLWYISAICDELGINMEDVAQKNIDKLDARARAGTIKGDGEGTRK